jgi:hypothetical protein
LALRIDKHMSNDRKTLNIRQQRKKDGRGVTDVLKTPAACLDIDLHCSLAEILDDFIRGRNSEFLIQTENGTMLSPENLFRGASSPYSRKWGEQACASMHSVASVMVNFNAGLMMPIASKQDLATDAGEYV